MRKINSEEIEIVKESLLDISDKIWDFINEKKYEIYILPVDKKFFLVPSELVNVMEKIQNEFAINRSGIPLGFIKKRKLYLSLEAAELFYNESLLDFRKYLVLSEQGEKSALYGNPIKKEMLLNFSPEIQKNELVFFINNEKEFLGIGLSKINYEIFKTMKFEDEVALNLVDKGSYLRKEQ